jgi:hypothetical protein
MVTLLLKMDELNMSINEEEEKKQDKKQRVRREALVLQTGSVIFETFCFCAEFVQSIL